MGLFHEPPQRRPYVSHTSLFSSSADSPVQALEECLAKIDQWEAAAGAFTVIEAQTARAAAEESTKRWKVNAPLSSVVNGSACGGRDHADVGGILTSRTPSIHRALQAEP
jgi:Asp-tRNA(Asn)/Glu-tRNA(Gln) amidotransferase A subunit family amidase